MRGDLGVSLATRRPVLDDIRQYAPATVELATAGLLLGGLFGIWLAPLVLGHADYRTPVKGLYINCGWGTGGFKAIPGSGWVFADTIANDRPHPIAEPFGLNRFQEGRLIDESVAAAVAH